MSISKHFPLSPSASQVLRPKFLAAALGCALMLQWPLAAASTDPNDAAREEATVSIGDIDPLASWNRPVFAFNERVDAALLKPAAKGYVKVVPPMVRTGVGNFFGNIGDVWSMFNQILQGKPGAAVRDFWRVAMNTTFGLGGVMDWATLAGLDRQGEDFGQTLGVWGVGEGAYLVLPLLGPSTLRDAAAWPVNRLGSASVVLGTDESSWLLTGTELVHTRSELLKAGRLLDDISLDKYTLVRDMYLQRRRAQVTDGASTRRSADEDIDWSAPPEEEKQK